MGRDGRRWKGEVEEEGGWSGLAGERVSCWSRVGWMVVALDTWV